MNSAARPTPRLPDVGNDQRDTPTRQAYDLIAQAFGPGANGPLLVAVDLPLRAATQALPWLVGALHADPGVLCRSAAGEPIGERCAGRGRALEFTAAPDTEHRGCAAAIQTPGFDGSYGLVERGH